MTKPQMHPDMQVLLQAREQTNAKLGPRGDAPEDARRWWNTYAAILAQPHPEDMHVYDRSIPTEEHDVPVRIYRPNGVSDAAPCIVYMHGGGFMMGDLDSSDSNAWGYAEEVGAVVVSVDYRLTPEHPYPAAFNDCYGVLCWLAANPGELGIDAGRIAVAGDSAGGNLGAALALAARDRGGPQIAAQALIYGSFGLDQDSGSYLEFAEGLGLTLASTQKFRRLYLPGNLDSDDPYARPIRARDFSGLPPALVHSAEMDPIRDDGRAYAARLALAGNLVTYREARGMVHGFLRARFTGATARVEFEAACAFLREQLAG
ncbi:MAG TPA: alpha/beta hydrolase [Thermomicrobiales bacterium]|nr:alpha/beta hydrolase [Thermomicrobiales bacterium]